MGNAWICRANLLTLSNKRFYIKQQIVRNMLDELKKELKSGENRAPVWALIVSFIIPLIGLIFYFIKKDKEENPKAYLIVAAAGFVANVILGVIF